MLQAFSLEGRRALVTGGNRGLGRAQVAALARSGAEVTFCGRDAAQLVVDDQHRDPVHRGPRGDPGAGLGIGTLVSGGRCVRA